MVKQIDQVLKQSSISAGRDRTNIRFYALYVVCARACKNVQPKAADIAKIDVSKLKTSLFSKAVDDVWKLFKSEGGDDRYAKGKDFISKIRSDIKIAKSNKKT